jgi:hypothetical protein
MSDDASSAERERLVAAISECKHRLSDLTRELDESMRAEEDDATVAELQRVREHVVELVGMLAELDAKT